VIKGVHVVAKRKEGKPIRWHLYAWRGGPSFATRTGGPKPKALTPAEVEAYQAIMDQNRAVKSDTIAGLIRDYRKSPNWEKLAAETKRNWTFRIDLIEAKWGDVPLAVWNDPRMVAKVMKWRDSAAATPREADYRITVLRHLLEWGRLRARVTFNAAAGLPHLYNGGHRSEIVWTDADIEAFAKHASQSIMDGLLLASYTGLRRADLVALTWDEVKENSIERWALKISRGVRRKATMPLIPGLRDLLADLRARPRRKGVETVLVNSFGNAWTGDGFGNSFIRARDAAGIKHEDGRKKHLHDVRGTFATKLILQGLNDQEVAGVLGWSPDRVANIRKVYVDQARVVVALGERLSTISVNRPVNQQGATGAK
jgi:integrase